MEDIKKSSSILKVFPKRYYLMLAPVICLGTSVYVSGFLFENVVSPSPGEGIIFEHIASVCQNLQGEYYIYAFDELKNRMLWCMSVLFFVIAFMINTYLLIKSMINIFKGLTVLSVLINLAVLIIMIFFACETLPFANEFRFNNQLLGPLVNRNSINNIIDIIEVAGGVMLVFLMVAASLLIFSFLKKIELQNTINQEAEINSNFHRILKQLLYGATITLIAGTLHSAAIYNWILTMVQSEIVFYDTQGDPVYYYNTISEVSTSFGAINGLFYSILMIFLFIPVFEILRQHSIKLAKRANPNKTPEEMEKWMTDRNLNHGFRKQIAPIISTLGPALVGGPLLSLLEMI